MPNQFKAFAMNAKAKKTGNQVSPISGHKERLECGSESGGRARRQGTQAAGFLIIAKDQGLERQRPGLGLTHDAHHLFMVG